MTGQKWASLFLAAIIVTTAGAAFHFATAVSAKRAGQANTARRAISTVSLPLFFEPNQGQTDPQVKFLARGSGYELFLTTDEAVLALQPSTVSHQPSAVRHQSSALQSSALRDGGEIGNSPATGMIRMRLEGASPTATITGSELLPGKSNYFIGNEPSKWRRNIPQYARVNYKAVYPGVDLVYYGSQGQLEYDFHVAPGADPGRIALNFEGASVRLDAGELVITTGEGDVRFHAPDIYQQDAGGRKRVEGGFRQLGANRVGFEIGSYDRSRELVIDPTLLYATYLGGSGSGGAGESRVHVVVGANSHIYLAGSTVSADFPVTANAFKGTLAGQQNIFIAEINPSLQPSSQLVYATYLGGSLADNAAGIAVDSNFNIYVAGWTTSTNFPTTSNAFQASVTTAGPFSFLSKLNSSGNPQLLYSTYLAGTNAAGNASDQITGLAIDSKGDAFVTGTTTSTNVASATSAFPASENGYQTSSHATIQFFASEINTTGSGFTSMLYSTYFGGGNPVGGHALGGGIALDTSGNIYITGGTDFLGVTGPSGEDAFPVLNAQQTCLNQAGINTNCMNPAPAGLDAFVAKINPNVVGAGGLIFSTFLGGNGDDIGYAVAVDSTGNPYVTGETFSTDWNASTSLTPFQSKNGNGGDATKGDAFIAKLGPLASGIYPLVYFTYLGGSGEDIGRAIAVDTTQAAHVTGFTSSPDLEVLNEIDNQPNGYGGFGDAFVALISTTISGRPTSGDYFSYLGGGGFDQGSGITLDTNNNTYVAGETQSADFPVTANAYQAHLKGPQNAFVAQIVGVSSFSSAANTPTVSPNPATVGNQVTFTFTFVNNGPDAANNVIFNGTLLGNNQAGVGYTFTSATASPGGSCPNPVNGKLICTVGTVATAGQATITVILVPLQGTSTLIVSPTLSANGGAFKSFEQAGPVTVDDFSITALDTSQTVNAGETTSYRIQLAPVPTNGTYANSISMSNGTLPAATTASFTTTPVTISGSGPASTTLNVSTTARPVGASLWPSGPVYATWLPLGGLSLLGLGAGYKWRRWLAGALLGLLAGIILLQAACGKSSSTPATTGGTPAGTYFITVTGSSGSDSHNTTVTLVVK